DANLDKSPIVAITGQAGLHRIHKESHQYLDIVSLFRPITKWNTSVAHPDSVSEIVRTAFKIAETEKPGATHIELPEDMAKMKTNQKPIRPVTVRRPDPDVKALEDTVQLLKKSKHPLLLSGNGAVRKPAAKQLSDFVEKFNVPFVNTFMGQGAVSDQKPQSLFTIGLGFRDIVMDAMDKADLVIAVGYDIAEYPPDRWNSKGDKIIVHIDFTSAEVYTHYQPAVEIVADIAATFRELNRLFSEEEKVFDSSWYLPIRKRIIADIESYSLKPGQRFTVPGVLNILRSVMEDEDLLISDVGSHKLWIARNFPVNTPNGCLISNGLASMGFALPGAVAASLCYPKRRIVTAMGDGGFLMNAQELETARRVGAAFIVLIFNDNNFGLISWKQKMNRGKAAGTQIGNPDFRAFVESFGIKNFSPKNPDELTRNLKTALSSGELCVFDIPVDPEVNFKLTGKLRL
ncbi:MAG: acetolactate synthase large subunit, partial [Candidatus Omnitrophica bacterium]|nr:acetolactate synthase large subunit [Candidatus Omnitrophota bacterium]